MSAWHSQTHAANANVLAACNKSQLKSREGVVAEIFSVRRLTLWPRPRAAGTRRVSASSRLAQRDVAKAWYLANPGCEVREAFAPRAQRKAPGAGPTTRCYPLADVSRISGTGRFGGTRTAKDEHTNCTRICPFTQGFSVCHLNLSVCKISSLRGDTSWKKKSASDSSSSESRTDLRPQIVISNANAAPPSR